MEWVAPAMCSAASPVGGFMNRFSTRLCPENSTQSCIHEFPLRKDIEGNSTVESETRPLGKITVFTRSSQSSATSAKEVDGWPEARCTESVGLVGVGRGGGVGSGHLLPHFLALGCVRPFLPDPVLDRDPHYCFLRRSECSP